MILINNFLSISAPKSTICFAESVRLQHKHAYSESCYRNHGETNPKIRFELEAYNINAR